MLSNTLELERYQNWTGVLIEPSLTAFKELTLKHRKSWILNACLSRKTTPEKVRIIIIIYFAALEYNFYMIRLYCSSLKKHISDTIYCTV